MLCVLLFYIFSNFLQRSGKRGYIEYILFYFVYENKLFSFERALWQIVIQLFVIVCLFKFHRQIFTILLSWRRSQELDSHSRIISNCHLFFRVFREKREI